MEAHPGAGALFLDAGDGLVHQPGAAPAELAQPAQQQSAARQAPHIAHARVAARGDQAPGCVAFDHQGLQHELPARAQTAAHLSQVFKRRAAVIQNAHGEHRVEGAQRAGQRFDPHRQHAHGRVAQVALEGLELQRKQGRGVDADDLGGPGAAHAPAVVAVTAAHVQHPPRAEGLDVRGQAIPFPVRAPLRVDVYAEQLEGAFAPGMQAAQRPEQGVATPGRQVLGAADSYGARVEVALVHRRRGQGAQRLLPARQIPVASRAQAGGQLRGQQRGPGRQGAASPALLQPLGVDRGEVARARSIHLSAISEAKLKHWNHTSQDVNPAPRRRSRCASRVSGISTLSRASRLAAISSSL